MSGMRMMMPTPDADPPAARISMRTAARYVIGTMTVAHAGMASHGNASAAPVTASNTMLMIVLSADVGPGGKARLISAATATIANAPSRALSVGRQNGVCSISQRTFSLRGVIVASRLRDI